MEDTNDSVDVTEDTGSDVEQQTEPGEVAETKQEKTSETPEAKHSRLLRQTNKQRKAMGLPPLVEALVEKQTPKTQSKGFDYGQLAYLEAKGVTESADQTWLEETAKESGLELRELMGKSWVQAELKERKGQRTAEDATPTGSKGAGNAGRDSVDYWVSKITQGKASIKDIPDRQLRFKVVNARQKAATDKNTFYDS
jgi:hypothetical protein